MLYPMIPGARWLRAQQIQMEMVIAALEQPNFRSAVICPAVRIGATMREFVELLKFSKVKHRVMAGEIKLHNGSTITFRSFDAVKPPPEKAESNDRA